MSKTKDRNHAQPTIPITDVRDIPQGMSEAEEHAFWATHYLSDEVKTHSVAPDDPEFPPARKLSPKISLRIEADALERLKTIARKKGMGYQTLLKEFMLERLYEEEKREGIL